MTGAELRKKLLAAALEMQAGQGQIVYSPAAIVCAESGLSEAQPDDLTGVSCQSKDTAGQ
jgi:hypothetical protein